MAEPYLRVQEHLEEELAWLDLVLERAVLSFARPSRPAELEQFGGLIVREEEVLEALRESPVGRLSLPHPEGVVPDELRTRIDERLESTRWAEAWFPAIQLRDQLGLTTFELHTVLLALAPELSCKYEKVFAYLQDDVTRKLPTIDLALSLFCGSEEERWGAMESFHSASALRRYQILNVIDRMGDPLPLLSRRLRLDDRIVSYLKGSTVLDAELQRVAELLREPRVDVPRSVENTLGCVLHALRGHVAAPGAPAVVVHLFGRYGSGRQEVAEAVCAHFGRSLLVLDLRRVLSSPLFEEDLQLVFREALLQPAAVAVRNFQDALGGEAPAPRALNELLGAMRKWSRLTFLIGEETWTPIGLLDEELFLGVECPTPDYAARVSMWQEALAGLDRLVAPDANELASKFKFTPGQIRDALVEARAESLLSGSADGRLESEHLHAAGRKQATPHLGDLARKIEPYFTWSDIVLPEDQLGQLKEIVGHVRHAETVMGRWGFERQFPLGRAVTALFSGASGTGKTMAAEIIAKDLQLDLYRIDLSGVVSKYIGETEKNLNRIFQEAQDSNSILFFDEADALFGKRSEVKDSHDRYANIEVAYLLQRMEEYDGIVILATNLKKNMDAAFVRRMRFIIDFPFPDEADRERIWQRIFPEKDHLDEDVDFGFLARKLNITGGNIKNISLRAAYRAVAEGAPKVHHRLLIEAAMRELDKMGKLYTDDDFRRPGERARRKENGAAGAAAVVGAV